MKANELRIGNYVYVEPLNGAQQVLDVMCDCVNTAFIEGANYGMVQPIQLTEEWLLKFGFSKAKKGGKDRPCYHKIVSEDKVFEIWFNNKNCRLWNNKDDYRMQFQELWCEPNFVNQLQNLYFALTGEELTIK